MTTDLRCPECHQPVTNVGKFWICPEHGPVQLPAAPLTAGAAAERPRLFLSYGRRDAQDLADRLAVDLAANGFAVWQDTREIATGSSWQHEIVDGLRSAQVVVALMTPHSVRTTGSADNVDSICLGEISYALFNPPPRPVVPVMAQSCEPPLAIFHLDYVDLRAWSDSPDQYQAGFRRLLAGIQAALRGEKRYRRWHHQLDPFDFAAFLHGKRRDFTGRQWLFDRIDAWRAACQRERALLITGDPGTGKSAIVAELVHRNPGGQVLAYHCCQWDVADTLKASRFVRSLAAMIAGKLEGYAALMEDCTVQEALSQSQCEADPGSALEKGILTRLEHLHAPEDGPRYLLIDALDESLLAPPGSLTIVDLLASRLDRLPAWLKIVATTRKEAPVLDRLAGLRAETLDAQSPENLADVRQFLEARLSSPNLAEKLVESQLTASVVTETLGAKSAGNFLYVEQALRGLETGACQLTQLDALPPGLGGLYTLRFERQFPDEAAFRPAKRLLDVVVAACEPLTEQQLAAATELDLEEELPVVLEQLSSYVPARLDAEGQPRYAIYHKSLNDWLTDRSRRGKLHSASAKRGHERLAAACWSEYRRGAQQMSGYALRHLATHLLVTERWDDLESLLTDLSYLEAKTAAGLVFDLAGDFSGAVAALPSERPQRRILRLLEEALRRDIHFIARHAQDYPQGLFQCLWNSGWWYDCPEAAQHYVDGRPPSGPHTPTKMGLAPITDDRCLSHFRGSGRTPIMMSPCADDGTRTVPPTLKVGSLREPKHPAMEWPDYTLHQLLERWRAAKERTFPGFPWLRTLRPPAMHLGSAQLAVLRGHEDSVVSVAFSSDGARIISGSDDKTVRMWDARSGAELTVLRGHEDRTVAFSPDGERIVSASDDHTVRVRDARSGAELAVLRGHESRVNSMAFSPDGERIVSGSDDHTVRVWDAHSGAELAVLRGHEESVICVAFSADGERIASGTGEGLYGGGATVRVWDARSGAELAVLRHKSFVSSVAFSPDGERIVSPIRLSLSNEADYKPALQVWDARSGAELAVLPHGGHAEVCSVAFSPGGDRIVVVDGDATVRVWDAHSGAELAVLRGHEGFVNSVAFSPDGERIVSGSDDQTVRVWDARCSAELAVLRGHQDTEYVRSVAFSPDGERIVSSDAAVRVWDARSGVELVELAFPRGDRAVAFSADGERIVCGAGHTVRVGDARSGAELAVLRGHKSTVHSVAFSPGGERIVSGSGEGQSDNNIRVWDAQSGAELAVLRGHESRVSSVAISPDGERIVTGSGDYGLFDRFDNTVRVWDTRSGAELAVLRGHASDVSSVAVSADGERIVSGSKDQTVSVWDAHSGAELAVLRGHEHSVWSVAISPDGERIVSGSEDQTVRVWDARSGAELAILLGHEGAVHSVAVSPDGERIVSGGDQTVRVWDARSGARLAVLRGHKVQVNSVAVSPDGARIVSGSGEGQSDTTVRVWDARSGAQLAVLRGHEYTVRCVAFSPDGERIVSGGDETVRVWDARSGAQLAVLRGQGSVHSVAFSPDGARIVSEEELWVDDQTMRETVRVWDACSGKCLEVIQGFLDVRAIAAGSQPCPLRLSNRSLECAFERADSGRPVAWFPAARWWWIHPSGRTWAGAAANYLCLITLEGASPP